MFKVAAVYGKKLSPDLKANAMDTIAWLQLSAALAQLGCKVDVILQGKRIRTERTPQFRFLSADKVRWRDYDVLVTFYHAGFSFLKKCRGDRHAAVMSLLGSVVGSQDDTPGVYFYGAQHAQLLAIQNEIAARSRWVTIMTGESKQLWRDVYGQGDNLLFVPTGVERDIPPPAENPYANYGEKIAVYIGNIYGGKTQPEINRQWQHRLNVLGRHLKSRSIRLCFLGTGDRSLLDDDAVTDLGQVRHDQVYDYQYFAHAAVVLALGPVQHNESSKIYYYLRTGLPVVSERPIPNNHLIEAADCGFVVEYDRPDLMAAKIAEAMDRDWPRQAAIEYMRTHHTWEMRARVMRDAMADALGNGEVAQCVL